MAKLSRLWARFGAEIVIQSDRAKVGAHFGGVHSVTGNRRDELGDLATGREGRLAGYYGGAAGRRGSVHGYPLLRGAQANVGLCIWPRIYPRTGYDDLRRSGEGDESHR